MQPLVLISDTTAPCPERDAPLAVRHRPAGPPSGSAPSRSWRGGSRAPGTARTYANPADVFVPGHPGDGDVDVRYDLEWRGASVVFPYSMTTRYEQSAWIQGDVVGRVASHVDVYCPGQRDHSWGNRVWSFPWLWSAGHLPANRWFHGVRTLVPGGSNLQIGYVVEPDRDLETVEVVDVEYELDGDDLPTSAYLRIAGLEARVTPELHAPVLIQSPDGVASRFARSLCRFETSDGTRRSGLGRAEPARRAPTGSPTPATRSGSRRRSGAAGEVEDRLGLGDRRDRADRPRRTAPPPRRPARRWWACARPTWSSSPTWRCAPRASASSTTSRCSVRSPPITATDHGSGAARP